MNHIKNTERTVRRILTTAAKMVVSDDADADAVFSCIAIRDAGQKVIGNRNADEVDSALVHYITLFSPHRFGDGRYSASYGRGRKPFGSAHEYWDKKATPERQQLRRDALLFAAASYQYAG
jgi:hypothetical protein